MHVVGWAMDTRCSEESAQFLLENNCAKSDDNKPALLVPKVVCS